MNPLFLGIEAVKAIHTDQIRRYGGAEGIRDNGLLEAALAMPGATYAGQFLHDNLYMMVAAYLYHIVSNLVSNHPFVDGNKRAGFVAALVFLDINGVDMVADQDEAADLVLAAAQGDADKTAIADFLRVHSRPRGGS